MAVDAATTERDGGLRREVYREGGEVREETETMV